MKQLLIVEDDEAILEALSELLSDSYQVACAHDGAEALERMTVMRFDAVLTDLCMPVLDGLCLKREMDARGILVPVMLLSASRDADARAREMGAADYLPKPFEPTVLEARLAHLLQ